MSNANENEKVEDKIFVKEGHYDMGDILDFAWKLHEDLMYEKNFEIKSLNRKLQYGEPDSNPEKEG